MQSEVVQDSRISDLIGQFCPVVLLCDWLFASTNIERKVAWAFYCLNADINLDVMQYFANTDYAIPETPESKRIEYLEATVKKYYTLDNNNSTAKIKRIMIPGIHDGYYQFSGGGGICINTKLPGEPMVIAHPKMDGTDVSSLKPLVSQLLHMLNFSNLQGSL